MKELLPVGTIVKTSKGGSLKFMIGGYYPQNSETNVFYDYFGLLYPDGLTPDKIIFMFDHADIDLIEFLGYSTKESKSALLHLKEMKK